MSIQHQIPQVPLKLWFWQSREQRLLLALAGIAVLVQLMWFKYLYPYPNFLPDSYSYLDAAHNNQFINMWPIGYSWFLRLFSCFTNSHTALVVCQYLLLQASILYLLFTLAYLLPTGKLTLRILLCCSVLNPLLFHVSNFVSSDSLFATLSLIWLSQLLWIIYKPEIRLLIIHAIVLLLVFTVRYNALYYPLVSLLVISTGRARLQTKLAGAAAIVLLLGGFIGRTIYKYQAITGTTQFSGFSGWQLASNALFAYAHVPPEARKLTPEKFQTLHSITDRHMDSLNKLTLRPDSTLGIYYLWNEQAPLKKYIHQYYSNDSTIDGFKQWASMGPVYRQYGTYLIRQYPQAFARYYLWPNLGNYYSPEAEFLAMYNMGLDSIEPIATMWFKLKSNKVHSAFRDKKIKIGNILPVLLAATNLAFIVSFISFIFLDGLKKGSRLFIQCLWLMFLIWICNAGFSVLASPIVLRYQAFPMITTFAFMLLLLRYIIQESRSPKISETIYSEQNAGAKVSVELL